MSLYDDCAPLFSPCYSCLAETHSLYQCPLVNLNSKKKLVIERYTYTKPQERKKIIRSDHEGHLSRINYQKIKLSAIKIRFNTPLMRTYGSGAHLEKNEHEDKTKRNTNNNKKKKFIESQSLQSLRDLESHQTLNDEVDERMWASMHNLNSSSKINGDKSLSSYDNINSEKGAFNLKNKCLFDKEVKEKSNLWDIDDKLKKVSQKKLPSVEFLIEKPESNCGIINLNKFDEKQKIMEKNLQQNESDISSKSIISKINDKKFSLSNLNLDVEEIFESRNKIDFSKKIQSAESKINFQPRGIIKTCSKYSVPSEEFLYGYSLKSKNYIEQTATKKTSLEKISNEERFSNDFIKIQKNRNPKKQPSLQKYITEYEEHLDNNIGSPVTQTHLKVEKPDANMKIKKNSPLKGQLSSQKELIEISNNKINPADFQKNDRLFNYDFETISNFKHYFNNGNYKNRQEKYVRLHLSGPSQPSCPSMRRKAIASFK